VEGFPRGSILVCVDRQRCGRHVLDDRLEANAVVDGREQVGLGSSGEVEVELLAPPGACAQRPEDSSGAGAFHVAPPQILERRRRRVPYLASLAKFETAGIQPVKDAIECDVHEVCTTVPGDVGELETLRIKVARKIRRIFQANLPAPDTDIDVGPVSHSGTGDPNEVHEAITVHVSKMDPWVGEAHGRCAG